MKINRIYIDGFRNLDSVNVFLNDITCLVSVNNYGKSNFLEAVDFSFDFIKVDSDRKNSMMKNVKYIPLLVSNTGKNFKFEIELSTFFDNREIVAVYGFEFKWKYVKGESARIVSEYLKVKESESRKFLSLLNRKEEKAFYKSSITSRCDKAIKCSNNELLINKLCAFDDLFFLPLLLEINKLTIYIDKHFDSNFLFDSCPIIYKSDDNFSRIFNSSDIPRILYYIKENYKNKYEKIVNALILLFPDIVSVKLKEIKLNESFLSRGNLSGDYPFELSEYIYYLYVRNKNIINSIRFEQMSDGVKRLLSILSYITLAEINQLPLIAIEEPENSIHLGLLKKYVILLKKFVENSKLIIVSHSPYIINYVGAENLYIGIPNEVGAAKFNKIKKVCIPKMSKFAHEMDMTFGEYLFDILSGFSEDDLDLLSKSLEKNE